MVNFECESRDSSVLFALVSSLIPSRIFILNLKKEIHFQPTHITPRKLTLRIIKSTLLGSTLVTTKFILQ